MIAICSVEGCSSISKYKGLCGKHYKRAWRHGSPEKTLLNMEGGVCTVDGCFNRRNRTNGLCSKHGIRFGRHGSTDPTRRENGTGSLNASGYRLLTINGERVYEHIVKAEKALGKKLPPKAIVHHVDNLPWNNENTNLVICPDQAYHLLLHRRQKELGISFT